MLPVWKQAHKTSSLECGCVASVLGYLKSRLQGIDKVRPRCFFSADDGWLTARARDRRAGT